MLKRLISLLRGAQDDRLWVAEDDGEEFLRVCPYIDPRDPNPQPAEQEMTDSERERAFRVAAALRQEMASRQNAGAAA